MIGNKDADRSLLVPKWLSYRKSFPPEFEIARTRDLPTISKTRAGFNEDYLGFKESPNLTAACELLHSSIILDEIEVAREAAEYISLQENPPKAAMELARRFFEGDYKTNVLTSIDKEISRVRRTLRDQNRNSLLWVELGRLFTIKGEREKARRCVLTAIQLDGFNRYIVRSAGRFFIHCNEPDIAYRLAQRAIDYDRDPAILAFQINSSMLGGGRTPKLGRISLDKLPQHEALRYSELVASLGVIELKAGKEKQAKRLFQFAWSTPTETVTAHAEWIIRNIFPFLREQEKIDYSISAEASAWRKYFDLQLKAAIEYAREWSLEEPYSTHPFLCASGIACSAEDYDLAIDFAQEGLGANPQDYLLKNNLAYAYLKRGKLVAAKQVLDSIPRHIRETESEFLMATSGLYEYKKRNIDRGRDFYLGAFSLSKKKGNFKAAAKALLSLAIAEREAHTETAIEFRERALAESETIVEPSIKLLREALLPSLGTIR